MWKSFQQTALSFEGKCNKLLAGTYMENIYIVLYIIFWKTEGCANKNNENRLSTVFDNLVYDTVRKKVVKTHDCVFF
jgi:hypothetical protein